MSQDDILKIIHNEPGIIQVNIYSLVDVCAGTAAQQISKLVKWGLIRREPVAACHTQSYRLYPVLVSEAATK